MTSSGLEDHDTQWAVLERGGGALNFPILCVAGNN